MEVKKHITFITIIFVVIVGFLAIKTVLSQRYYIQKARESYGIDRIRYYERALLFYLPFSPYYRRGVEEFNLLCSSIQKDDEKLYCFETLRTVLLQSDGIYQPYSEVVESITPEIAKLRQKLFLEWNKDYPESKQQELYSYYLELLQYKNRPSTFWSMISILSFFGWVSSVIYGIYRRFLFGLLSFFVFFSLWIFGLYMA